MAVISVTITQSSEQVVAGIPRSVSVSTNIPATIFYTLDGTAPTLFSTMYTGPIFLPFDKLLVTLQILATNGTDSSPIVAEVYMTDIVDSNLRLPHSATTAHAGSVLPDNYPYGTTPFQPKQGFLNPAQSGVNVYDPTQPATPTGFDGSGNPTGFTNQPYDITNYQIVYNTTDAEGNTGPNIGDLPAITTMAPQEIIPESTNQFTSSFNPKALVIFQDFSKEDPSDPPQINRQYFTLEDPEKVRDGTFYLNTGLDSTVPPSGSFVRAHYNPKTGNITHYYRDSWANRWIISEAPYVPTGTFDGNMAASAVGRNSKVFEWIPYARRILF